MKRFLEKVMPLIVLLGGLGLGAAVAWVSKPTLKAELQKEKDAKARVAKELKNTRERYAGCAKTRDDWGAKLSQCINERDRCSSLYEERGRLLSEKGDEMRVLYDALAEIMEISPEQAKEFLCVQRGGYVSAGDECECNGEWQGAMCVSPETQKRKQPCEASGGEWKENRCYCGIGMVFSEEKGCVKRPYPKPAQEAITDLQKQVRKLKEEKNLYVTAFNACRTALAKPPKIKVVGAKAKCDPPSACESK